MSEEEHLVDIPKEFFSFHNDAPFSQCIECERNLLEDDCDYVIEKAVKNYQGFEASDVVFDYAICMECAEKIHNELSKESMQNIQLFFTENLDVSSRANQIAEAKGDLQKMISSCMISNQPKKSSAEYQIFAHCRGTKVNLQNPPYMLSGEVLAELADLLSDKTLDDLNGFFNKHFSPDPTLMEPTPRLVLI